MPGTVAAPFSKVKLVAGVFIVVGFMAWPKVATTASTNTLPFGYTTAAQADNIVFMLNRVVTALEAIGILAPSSKVVCAGRSTVVAAGAKV